MIGPLRNRTLAISVVAALQILALGYMVWDRERRVRSGTDIVLEAIPVDPRSLFQGDYVVLGYPVSTVRDYFAPDLAVGSTIYVKVRPGDEKGWQYAGYSLDPMPPDAAGGVSLKGRIESNRQVGDNETLRDVRVSYGLERFFVPEGKGLGLEALVREKKLSAIVAVWRDGSSALKGLSSEGKVLFETGVAAKKPEEVPIPGETGMATAPVTQAPTTVEAPQQAPPTPQPSPAQPQP